MNTADNFYKNKNPYEFLEKNITSVNNKNNNLLAFQAKCAKDYEIAIKTSHENIRKNYTASSRQIKYKMLESDIFFFRNTDEEKKNFLKENKNKSIQLNYTDKKPNNHLESDIFNIKNNQKSVGKIGEKSLLLNRNLKDYHNSQKSNSEWYPKNIDFKSYVNHHSCEYDIIKPNIVKKIYTRNILVDEASGNNPAKRQKGLSEFNDLSRIGLPNPNKEYIEAFKNNQKIFLKNENMCNDFLNLYKKYENIIEKPFQNKGGKV